MARIHESSLEMPAASSGLKAARWEWFVLGIILLTAASVRWFKIESDRFWNDEIWSMELAAGHGTAHIELPADRVLQIPIFSHESDKQPIGRVWTAMTGDIHPPLYYLLLRLWLDAFGWSDATATSLSVVVSLLGLVVFWDLLRRINGRRSALFGAGVMAMAGFGLEYAREARCYMLQQLLVLLAADLIVRIEQNGAKTWRAGALGIAMFAAMVTHYFSAPALAGLFIYAMIRLKGPSRIAVIGATALSIALFAALWLPWGIQQLRVVDRGSRWLGMFNDDAHWYTPLWYLAQLPTRIIGPSHIEFLPQSRVPLQLLGAAVFVLPVALWKRRPDLHLWALMLLCMGAFVWMMDAARHITLSHYVRYLTPAVAPTIAILCVTARQRPISRFWEPALLVCAATSFVFAVWPWAPSDRDFRGAAQFIEKRDAGNSVIVYHGWPDAMVLNSPWASQLSIGHYLSRPRPVVLLSGPVNAALDQQLRQFDRVFLHTFPGEPEKLMPGWKCVKPFGTRSVTAGMVWELSPR